MRKRNVLLGLVAAGVLAIGGVVGVAAQTPGGVASAGGDFIARLAANLGIGEDQLKAAIDLTRTQPIDEALAAGELTQDEADQLRQRLADGQGFGFRGEGRHDGMKGGRGVGVGIEIKGAIADLLGLEPQALMEELMSGKSLAEIAQEQNISIDTLKTELTAQAKAHLDQAVADGKLTAEQASAMLDKLSEKIDSILNGEFRPHDLRGERGPWGEHRGRMAPPAATSSAASIA